MWVERLGLDGKHAVITGGSSGMGAAAAKTLADVGAVVTVLDVKPPEDEAGRFLQVDLREEASIDTAVAAIDQPVHVLLNCAGIPQTFPYADVFACNIIGLRHLTESLLGKMEPGSSIVNVSSIAGSGWRKAREVLAELLATSSVDEAKRWVSAHPDLGDPYVWSKMALNLYTLQRAPQLAATGVRMNAICPGNTTTAMSTDFEEVSAPGALDLMASIAGRPALPQEQADALVFLSSSLASYVSGTLIPVDGGYTAAAETRQLSVQVR